MSSLYKLLLNTENTDKYISEKYIPTKIIGFLISDYIFIDWNKGYVKKIISLEFKKSPKFHSGNIACFKHTRHKKIGTNENISPWVC